jgi:hypothetical protein
MKWNLILPAMVLSLGLCSQSFGFELLNKMLGHHRGGCNSCCETSCCEQQCCQPACEPACCEQPACCEPACEPSCCEQDACCDPCNSCCKKKRCDLFGGLRGLFDHGCKKSCCDNGCNSCCEPACEPACCEQPACEPACCEQPSCCDPCNSCCKKKRCGLFAGLFHRKKSCCNTGCGGCDSCGGCSSCGGGVGAPAAAGDAAPVPPAPMADPSASYRGAYRLHNTSMVRSR